MTRWRHWLKPRRSRLPDMGVRGGAKITLGYIAKLFGVPVKLLTPRCPQTAAGPCPEYGEHHQCGYPAPGHRMHICKCGHWWHTSK